MPPQCLDEKEESCDWILPWNHTFCPGKAGQDASTGTHAHVCTQLSGSVCSSSSADCGQRPHAPAPVSTACPQSASSHLSCQQDQLGNRRVLPSVRGPQAVSSQVSSDNWKTENKQQVKTLAWSLAFLCPELFVCCIVSRRCRVISDSDQRKGSSS